MQSQNEKPATPNSLELKNTKDSQKAETFIAPKHKL